MARPKSVNLSRLIKSSSCISKDKSNFIHWAKDHSNVKYDRSREEDLENYDIACVGPCVQDNTWPSYLEKETNLTCGNFSQYGIDHFTVVHNAHYILKNYKINVLILQLGPYDFLLPKRDKINDYFVHRIVTPEDNLVAYREWCIKNYSLIRKIVSNKLLALKNYCDSNKVSMHILYTDKEIRPYPALQEHVLPIYINDFDKSDRQKNFAFGLKNILR